MAKTGRRTAWTAPQRSPSFCFPKMIGSLVASLKSGTSSKTEENKPAGILERTEENTLDMPTRKLPFSWPLRAPPPSKQKVLRGRLRGLISENSAPFGDKNIVPSTMKDPKIDTPPLFWYIRARPVSEHLRPFYGNFDGADSSRRNQWTRALSLINWFENWDRKDHVFDRWDWAELDARLNLIEAITGDLKTSWGDLDTTIKTQKTVGRLLSTRMNERKREAEVDTALIQSFSEYKVHHVKTNCGIVLGLVAAYAIQGLNLNPRDAPDAEARIKVEEFLHHRLGPKSKQLSLQGIRGLLTAAMDNLWMAVNHVPESTQSAQPTSAIDEHA
ncbi:hypothetical protein M408DRAFT_9012 [Serendipita vermifera MAFF 305830]|uniref:Uncharacterized protein n=1 Tax=Serendipita vermifera MAFF 305830 TaxID=933852 RepID=A0A0C3B7M5_SERVB|nr:hypothetical protein M408DRAFT_9012 [Serendipita vermifera MAFF 305830]